MFKNSGPCEPPPPPCNHLPGILTSRKKKEERKKVVACFCSLNYFCCSQDAFLNFTRRTMKKVAIMWKSAEFSKSNSVLVFGAWGPSVDHALGHVTFAKSMLVISLTHNKSFLDPLFLFYLRQKLPPLGIKRRRKNRSKVQKRQYLFCLSSIHLR